MADQPSSTVHRSVEVELPPAEVWELLVDDDERAGWFGGPTTLEPVPGGAGLFTDPDGTRRRGRVEEVTPERRLAWTWWPEDGDGSAASRVEVDLRPVPGGTRVSVTEAPMVPTASASVRRPDAALPLLALEATCLLRSWSRVLA